MISKCSCTALAVDEEENIRSFPQATIRLKSK